ncbi:hypothetical protein B0H12DRAFT_1240680 [Mycena haematopus]|nr:hypothetical protein B0H12DRAFT_1240680 [Mycena haematopus]
MAPPPWASPLQLIWLQGWLSEFIQRQAENKLHLFWPTMYEAWFKENPEHCRLGLPLPKDADARELTPDELAMLGTAIKAKKLQLQHWFRNNRKKVGSATVPSAAASILQRILKIGTTKRQRAHQPVEIFQKRNPALIKAALTEAGYDALTEANNGSDDEELTAETEESTAARMKTNKAERMRLRTRVVRALWAEASQEEREAVEAEVEKEKKELREDDLRREKEASDAPETDPWQLQEGIDSLDGMLAEVHKAVFNASKWIGVTLVGGPNPRMGGDLTLKVICFGQSPAGNDFEESCIDFDQNVVKPFQDFLRLSYSAADRQACALPARPSAVSGDETPAERIPTTASPAPEAEKPKKKKKSKKKSAATIPASTRSPPDPAALASVPAAASSESLPENVGVEDTSYLTPTLRLPSTPSSPFVKGKGWIYPGDSDHDNDTFALGDGDFSDGFGQDFTLDDDSFDSFGLGGGFAPNYATPTQSLSTGDASETVDKAPTPLWATTSSALYPHPRPAYRTALTTAETVSNAPAMVNVNGFNFPAVADAATQLSSRIAALEGTPNRVSGLFQAFRSLRSPPQPTPVTYKSFSVPGFPGMTTSTSPAHSAIATAPIAPVAPTTVPVAPVAPSTAPVASPAPITAPVAPVPTTAPTAPLAPTTVPAAPLALTTAPVAPLVSTTALTAPLTPTTVPVAPLALTTEPVAPLVSTTTPFVLVAPTTAPTAPLAPTTTPLVPVALTTAPVAPVAPRAHTTPVVPGSRPQAKPAVKKAPARMAPAKKTSTAKAAGKEGAAAEAKKVVLVEEGAKKRGRPRKQPLTDITNEADAATNATPVSPTAQPSTPTEPAAEPSKTPTHVYTMTNNNAARARQAAAAAKAMEAKEKADAEAKQAAKGWLESTVDGATVVTLTRARKPTRLADGTVAQREVKKARAPKLDASEIALLARTVAPKKRKAEPQALASSKRRKV